MGIRHWQDSDFFSDSEKAQHRERATTQWREAMECWFWLCGSGMTAPEWLREGKLKWHSPSERAKAERVRVMRGWSFETLNDVHLANDGRRANRAFFGGGKPAQAPRKRSGARRAEYDPTLEDSDPRATQRSASGPPPSVERDWPEKFEMSDAERVALREAAFNGSLFLPGRSALREVAVEILYE